MVAMAPRLRSLLTLATLLAAVTLVTAHPASACSCATGFIAETVRDADAVYIGSRRPLDLMPGANFRVVRALKGPTVHNMRVPVMRGGDAGCGAPIRWEDHVLTVRNGTPMTLSLCSQYLIGEQAVSEAVATLGPGHPVPWRPDPVYITQWIVLGALGYFAVRRWRRHRARRYPSDSSLE